MAFMNATRMRRQLGDTFTRPVGGGRTTISLPRSGILSDIFLNISGSVAGTLSAPNALGMSSIVRRVQLQLNNGINVYDSSGAGYSYLVSPMLDAGQVVTPQNTGQAIVTATTFNLDMKIPVAINNREELGLIMLQNTDVIATLVIDWESDAIVATGATVTATVVPTYTLFDVPTNQADMPFLGAIHRITEDSQVIAGAGVVNYQWPIGNVYLGVYHLCIGSYTRAQCIAQQSNIYYDYTPDSHRMIMNSVLFADTSTSGGQQTGFNERLWFDFLLSDGGGAFGSTRDVIDTLKYSDIKTVLTAAAAGTLYSVKRELVFLTR